MLGLHYKNYITIYGLILVTGMSLTLTICRAYSVVVPFGGPNTCFGNKRAAHVS